MGEILHGLTPTMIMRPKKWPQAKNTSAHWIVVDTHSLNR